MKYLFVALCLFSMTNAVGLYYDDSTFGGMSIGYSGVWFHTEDFFPSASSIQLTEVEMWFYHHPSYLWDTSEYYLEIWSGNEIFPEELLHQSLETAVHYSPVLIDVSQENVVVELDFWILKNTELSAGGWPSAILDESPPVVPHSCGSEGWITAGDLLFRCFADETSIESISWGALKTVF